jgi:hypothetical protein
LTRDRASRVHIWSRRTAAASCADPTTQGVGRLTRHPLTSSTRSFWRGAHVRSAQGRAHRVAFPPEGSNAVRD